MNKQKPFQSLKNLTGIVSKTIILKIVNAGLDFEKLLTTFKNAGTAGLVTLLTVRNDQKKARVTKHTKIILKITTFIENYKK